MSTLFNWTGRLDGSDAEHWRIHQVINQSANAEYVLLGFVCDEGVRRNQGRQGAALAPDVIRSQFASLPVHQPISLTDAGNVICQNGKLEVAQAHLSTKITELLNQGQKPIVWGGGHEIALASFTGIFQHLLSQKPQAKLGVINFDAHFDLRKATQATSGTPFLQAANLSQKHQKAFQYMVLGVAKQGNTKVLFDTADSLNCSYILDQQLNWENKTAILAQLNSFLDTVDELYVTIDLDVFSAHVAPGVSAPAVRGIDLPMFEWLFKQIKQTNKIKLLDIAECNPKFDVDNRTAKLAAYITYQYLFDF